MRDLAELVIADGEGPRRRITKHYCAGRPGHHGLEEFLHKSYEPGRWRICNEELVERLWKILLKRRAPQYVIEALIQWRHTLEGAGQARRGEVR